MPVVVLDRDGVINEDSDDYVRQLSEWHPIPGSIDAICRLSRAGFSIAVATNQSGLSRGYFGLDELEEIHQHLCQLVEEGGGRIDGIFYCPHLPDAGCNCPKLELGVRTDKSWDTCDGAGAVKIDDLAARKDDRSHLKDDELACCRNCPLDIDRLI